ncbi:MAG: Glycogen synthase [Chlamydiae bacterium]|nr:Glycogen synthase [Chlamydiota bacterium]
MDIVHIASELAPIAKVGGLGDVTYGLSKALVKKNHRVRIFLPKYDCLDVLLLKDLHIFKDNFLIQENNISISNTLWSAKYEDLELVLVEAHHPKGYFDRGKIYGEEDDNDRFLYFCKVASTELKKQSPDVIHLHDWPSAGCALFLKHHVRTIFTIHNLQHQGRCASFNLERLGIEVDEEVLCDPQFDNAINLLKGAIQHSDVITTVSPTYREEILTLDGGCGLHEELFRSKKKLQGILNGIDTDYWNPETDTFLARTYTKETVSEGKKANKDHLKLSQDKPLVTAITRLVSQKGPDLIHYGIEKTLELGGQFVLLGTTDDEEMRAEFEALKAHPDVTIHLDYDEPLSHFLYAASDMLLMPSIFEPCGLAQMIALRYGSVPLVHATGGLKDTVFDEKNGYTFKIPDNKGVASVLERAFEAIQTDKWQALIQTGMQENYSWGASAEKYLKIYQV